MPVLDKLIIKTISLMNHNFRTEIAFKNIEQLNNKIQFCLANNISKINIPCKGVIKKDFLLEVVDFIGMNYRNLDTVYHYSFYHQFSKNKNNSYDYFLRFIEKCNVYGINEILLVSGSKKRKYFDVINVLNELRGYVKGNINFGIAYNPYFSDMNDVNEERNRLLKKLSTGLVNSIWFQLGSDINLLKRNTLLIKTILEKNFFYNSKDINIYGSLFIPSKQSLARFKFRPWKGVFLSNDYLNSIEKACVITKDIVRFYLENNIRLLIESECSTNKQLKDAIKIIET